MRIALVTARRSNHPWGAENFLIKAIRNLGHRVVLDLDFRLDDLVPVSRTRADILLVFKGSTLTPRLLGRFKGKKILWYPDDIATPWGRSDLHRLSGCYDQVYTLVPENVDEIGRLNPRTEFLMPGVDLETFRAMDIEKKYDVSFVGNTRGIQSDRQAVLESVRSIPGIQTFFGAAYMGNLARVYNRSRIVLNIGFLNRGFQLRILEAMACGSCLLTNRTPTLERVIRESRHLGPIVDLYEQDSLMDRIRFLLEDDRWKTYGEAGLKFARENTWEHRVQKIFQDAPAEVAGSVS